jgi:murein DD-endopeptidase MepM/ murein hydrolase activator NlpD
MNTNKKLYLIKGFFILVIFMAISGSCALLNHAIADDQQNSASANLPKFTHDELLNNVESRMKYLNARVQNTNFYIYTAKHNETLLKIARIHGRTVQTLIGLNPQLTNFNVGEGQKILFSIIPGTLHPIQNNDTWEAVAGRYGTEEATIKKFNFGVSALIPGEYLFIPYKRPDVSLLNKQMQEQLKSAPIFNWPLNFGGEIIKTYGKSKDSDTGKIHDNGIVIANKPGTSVCSSADGKVIFAGYDEQYGYGLIVYIEHENGYITEYGHLSSSSYRVKVGTEIKAGKPFAQLGNSGLATEPCLYFAIKKDGKYVDPMKFFD